MTRDASSPRTNRRRVSRRRLLRLGGAMTASSLAGCQERPEAGSSRGGTTDDRSPTRRPGTTTARGTIRFDGGGAAAFSEALRAAEANPGSTLEVEAGTYRLDRADVGHDQPHSHFTADGLRDVTIEGNGARFVLEDPTLGALGLFNGEGVTLRNLELDYDPPPFTQATIATVDESRRTIEVEVQAGMPSFESPALSHPSLTPNRRWATVHDPETGNFLDERSGGATKITFDDPESMGERRYRIRNLQPFRGVAPGRLFVAVARLPFKHALVVFDCVEPTVENVTLYTAPGFSVLSAFCEAPTFRGVTVRPRPDSGRVVASTADGIHVLNCAPGPTIENCRMERLQDDAYVVASLMHTVTEVVDDRTVRVEPLLGTRIRPGDDLEGIDAEFARLGALPAVESVAETTLALPGEWGWPARVTFAKPVAGTLDADDFLRNHSRSNQGFAIRNCVSRNIRSRHVRVTSRDGTVEGNELDGCATPAVMLAGGTFFSPQSPPENVTVRNNTILRAGLNGFTSPFDGAIDAWINLGAWQDGPRPPGRPIRNLTVVGNTVRRSAFKGIQVNDADGVAIRDNVVEEPNRVGFDGEDDYAVGLVNDRAVEPVGNRASGSSSGLDQFAVQAGVRELSVRSNALTIDGDPVPPEVVDGD